MNKMVRFYDSAMRGCLGATNKLAKAVKKLAGAERARAKADSRVSEGILEKERAEEEALAHTKKAIQLADHCLKMSNKLSSELE